MASAGPIFPDPISGAMHLSPLYIIESGPQSYGFIRGILPGLWMPCHLSPANQGDLITGSGESSGKTFMMANVSNTTATGRAAFEVSDTW